MIYSYVTRLPIQILLIIILFPLFYVLNNKTFGFYIIFAGLAIIFPLLGLLLKWQWYKFRLERWSLFSILFVIFTSGYYVALDPKNISSIFQLLYLLL